MDAFDPKWVNPNDIQYGVNLLRYGGLHLLMFKWYINMLIAGYIPVGKLSKVLQILNGYLFFKFKIIYELSYE